MVSVLRSNDRLEPPRFPVVGLEKLLVFQIREAVSTATPKSRHGCPPSDMGRTSAPSPFFAEVAGAEDQAFNLFTVVLHGLADDYSITSFPNSSTSASLFNISSKYPSSTDSSSSSSKCSSYHQFLVPSAPSRCAQDNSTFKRPRMPSHLRLFRQIAVRRERGMIHPAYVPCRRASVVFPPRRQPFDEDATVYSGFQTYDAPPESILGCC